MSFLDRLNGAIIIGDTSLMNGSAFVPLEEFPRANEEGWDDLTITYLTRRESLTSEALSAAFPLGTRLGTRSWWVAGSAPSCLAAGVWRAEVFFKGWAQLKPAKITIGGSAESQSGENIQTPIGLRERVQTHENTPTMRITYPVLNYTDAPTQEVGRSRTPPEAIAVADTVWNFLTNPTYHFPNGWVLMGSNVDKLVGANAAIVSDDYKFIREFTP